MSARIWREKVPFPRGNRADRVVFLDRPKRVVVSVETGWNDIEKAEMMVKSTFEVVKFLVGATVCNVSSENDGMHLEPLVY
jgi:hypothetical protein